MSFEEFYTLKYFGYSFFQRKNFKNRNRSNNFLYLASRTSKN